MHVSFALDRSAVIALKILWDFSAQNIEKNEEEIGKTRKKNIYERKLAYSNRTLSYFNDRLT